MVFLHCMTEQLGYDAFDEFTECVLQGDWAICTGFCVVRLSWLPNDDSRSPLDAQLCRRY